MSMGMTGRTTPTAETRTEPGSDMVTRLKLQNTESNRQSKLTLSLRNVNRNSRIHEITDFKNNKCFLLVHTFRQKDLRGFPTSAKAQWVLIGRWHFQAPPFLRNPTHKDYYILNTETVQRLLPKRLPIEVVVLNKRACRKLPSYNLPSALGKGVRKQLEI